MYFDLALQRANCFDGKPTNKWKKHGDRSIQAGESPTQPKGSGKASSSRCKKRKFIESWKKDYSWLEYVRCVDYLEHKNKRKLIKRSLLRRYTGTCSFI